MIFDAYGPTDSVAILHPRELKLFSEWTRVVREATRYPKMCGHFRRVWNLGFTNEPSANLKLEIYVEALALVSLVV